MSSESSARRPAGGGLRPEADGRTLFESHRELIDRVIGYVCSRHRLRAQDAEEFAAHVHLKLIEGDCQVLRRFEGRSSVQTFLTVVVHRLFLDYRNHEWGKWRPSAAARRDGPTAVLLERLLTRDGLTLDEAVEVLASRHDLRLPPGEVERLVALMPPRTRRQHESDAVLVGLPSPEPSAEALAMAADRRQAGEQLLAALDRALASLEPQDQLALRLRFEDGRTVAGIAAVIGVEPRRLYARMTRLFAHLRAALEEQGFQAPAVLELIGTLDGEKPGDESGTAALRPSMAKGT